MKFSEIELPSNRKFGFFFTFVFAAVAAYFYYSTNVTWAYVFIAAALVFLLVTLIKSDALLPLNKLWMRFGLSTWHDSKPNRTWGYFLWAFYTHSNTYAPQWTR